MAVLAHSFMASWPRLHVYDLMVVLTHSWPPGRARTFMTSWSCSHIPDHPAIRLRHAHHRCTRRNFPGPLSPSLRVQVPMLPHSLRHQAPACAHTTTRACTLSHIRHPRALCVGHMLRGPRLCLGLHSRVQAAVFRRLHISTFSLALRLLGGPVHLLVYGGNRTTPPANRRANLRAPALHLLFIYLSSIESGSLLQLVAQANYLPRFTPSP